jgi:FAD:protein FMN transferase
MSIWNALKNHWSTRPAESRKTASKVLKAVWYSSHFEGVLGTALELKIRASSSGVAATAQKLLLAEIERLEWIFSRFLPESELCRWLNTSSETTSKITSKITPKITPKITSKTAHETTHETSLSLELAEVLQSALHWQQISQGVFHPGSDALSVLWKAAEQKGLAPDPLELKSVVQQLQGIPYTLERRKGSYVARRSSGVSLNLNAIAKGYIVDLAGQVALDVAGVQDVLINIGGDLRHMGKQKIPIGIADPRSSAHNLPPIAQIQIGDQAVASSGHQQRGFWVGQQWYSHLLDPRTGYPVPARVSASVLADNSSTADVLATVFSILPPLESLKIADQLPRVGCLLITHPHDSRETPSEKICNAFWNAHSSETYSEQHTGGPP